MINRRIDSQIFVSQKRKYIIDLKVLSHDTASCKVGYQKLPKCVTNLYIHLKSSMELFFLVNSTMEL